jgi:hypothetical protein
MSTAKDFTEWDECAKLAAAVWQPHMEFMQDCAREAGYWDGFDAGEKATHDQYQRWLGVAREVLKSPTRDALERARRYTDEPCSTNCGRCSRCIRASAVIRNKARYGSADYPGGPVEWGDRP